MHGIYQDISLKSDISGTHDHLQDFLDHYVSMEDRAHLVALHEHDSGLTLVWSEKVPLRWSRSHTAVLPSGLRVSFRNLVEKRSRTSH